MQTSWVNFNIKRGPVYGDLKNRVGLQLSIQVRKDIEEFMRNMSEGKVLPLEAYATDDSWVRLPREGGPLEVYAIDLGHSTNTYTLRAIGGPLLINPNRIDPDQPRPRNTLQVVQMKESQMQVNLSFLTLVGISGENGLTIGLPGAVSWDYIQSARNLVPQAIKQFLSDYVVPITINLQIVSREM